MGDSGSYTPIPTHDGSQSIRVLDVHASFADFEEPVRGDLRIVDLRSDPCFCTLSYVWGSPDEGSRSVICGTHSIPLLPNGHSALKALRRKLGKFTIWIDAVCINQNDDDEKQHQIPLMGEIYSKAKFGYIWLGTGNRRTKRAMEYLAHPPFSKHLKAASLTNEDGRETWRPSYAAAWLYFWQRFKIRSSLWPPRRRFWILPTTTTMEDINLVLQNDWIERVWTYQELLLSSRPILVCGQHHLDWDIFACSVAFLDYKEEHWVGRGTTPASLWLNLAWGRYQVQKNSGAKKSTFYGHKLESRVDATPLNLYTGFISHTLGTVRAIEARAVFGWLILWVPPIPLFICGMVAVVMYGDARKKQKALKDYNKVISLDVEWIISSRLVPPSTTTRTLPVTQVRSTLAPTTTRTKVSEILADLKATPTVDVHNAAIRALGPRISSAVNDCWSSCSQPRTTVGCFALCASTHTAMPQPTRISIREAFDFGSRTNYGFCWGVVWAITAWIAMAILHCCLQGGCWKLSNRKAAHLSGRDSPKTVVNIIDALLKRKAKYDHDKAFGMQSILRRLTRDDAETQLPDYKAELGEVFHQFNIQLYKLFRHQQLIYIAALSPLPGHPSWMPDWSADIDPMWLSSSINLQDLIIPSYGPFSSGKVKLVHEHLQISALRITEIKWSTIRFQACTNSNGEMEASIQLENLAAALSIFTIPQSFTNGWVKIDDLTSLCSFAAGQSPKDIKQWLLFLQSGAQRAGTDTKSTLETLRERPKLFRTHISVCNSFSLGRKKLFYYTRTKSHVPYLLADSVIKTQFVFGVCRDVSDLSGVGLAAIFLHSLLFLVRFDDENEKKDYNDTEDDKRLVDATLISPVLFARDIGYGYRQSARTRFRWDAKDSDGTELVLRLA